MPRYKINITPEVSQIVEANNIDDARKIVKAEIAKGVISPVYDELLFDYDTGVDDLRIRRLLGRAERLDEKEIILQNYVMNIMNGIQTMNLVKHFYTVQVVV